jgi:hypothetical protein
MPDMSQCADLKAKIGLHHLSILSAGSGRWLQPLVEQCHLQSTKMAIDRH